MNCLILVLLLLSCGNGECRQSECSRRSDRGNDRSGRRDEDERDCGCRNDARSESRLESRSFISYPGSGGGCDEPRNSSGCDCGD